MENTALTNPRDEASMPHPRIAHPFIQSSSKEEQEGSHPNSKGCGEKKSSHKLPIGQIPVRAVKATSSPVPCRMTKGEMT